MHATGSGGVYAVVYMYGFERRSCWQTKTSTYAHGLPFMLNAFAYFQNDCIYIIVCYSFGSFDVWAMHCNWKRCSSHIRLIYL